jgi:hypothetical protein
MSHALATRPPAGELVVGGADVAALEAALLAARTAKEKGLPPAVRIGVLGDSIEAALLLPDLLLWVDLLDDGWRVGRDAAGNLVVRAFTSAGEGEPQRWTLRPVVECCPAVDADGVLRSCRRCADLPDHLGYKPTAEAWRDQKWWELTGRRWDEPVSRRALTGGTS